MSNIHFDSKLPDVGTTIFTVMSTLAVEHNAINLSQGFPDFMCSEQLVELVNKYMKQGMNQYAPMPGIPSLRNTISDKVKKMYGHHYRPDTEITVTAGGTQALYTAITALVSEGDEVIIIDPAYDCYAPAVQLCGGIPIHISLIFPDYTVDWNKVKSALNKNTRMIIINTPNNPSGTVFNANDMLQLQELVKDTNVIILSDEVYEHIIFDTLQHESVCKYPELANRSLVVASFGKTFHTTGWKMGYILAPEYLMKEFRKVHQFNVFSCNTPIQHALNEFMQSESNYINLPNFYQLKRDYFLKSIATSRFKPLKTQGTYFQLLSYENISDEKDTDFAIRLTKEFKIASIPVSVFYKNKEDNKVLRFCFAKSDSTLDKAAEILCNI